MWAWRVYIWLGSRLIHEKFKRCADQHHQMFTWCWVSTRGIQTATSQGPSSWKRQHSPSATCVLQATHLRGEGSSEAGCWGEGLKEEMTLEFGLKGCDWTKINPVRDRGHWGRRPQLGENTMCLGPGGVQLRLPGRSMEGNTRSWGPWNCLRMGKYQRLQRKAVTPAETDGSGLVCRPGCKGRVWQAERPAESCLKKGRHVWVTKERQ